MMDWTDRHCRYFHRIFSRRAVLYSEMVTAPAVIHGNRAHLLGFDEAEHPVVLQLGGSDPEQLAEAARIGQGFGYDAINLNVGCPSDRVQSGCFGAALMAEPDVVARCIAAMRRAVDIPVTVKCRIGIDNQDEEKDLSRFIAIVAGAGCGEFIVHARKAWLKGLSPKENRDVPPLDYARVYRLKQARPDLVIHLNGGIAGLSAAAGHLAHADGVMIGRAACHDPWCLAGVDPQFYNQPAPVAGRREAVEKYMDYMGLQLARGVRLSAMTRHILGLFRAAPGARQWRRTIAEGAHLPGAGLDVVRAALSCVREPAADRRTVNV